MNILEKGKKIQKKERSEIHHFFLSLSVSVFSITLKHRFFFVSFLLFFCCLCFFLSLFRSFLKTIFVLLLLPVLDFNLFPHTKRRGRPSHFTFQTRMSFYGSFIGFICKDTHSEWIQIFQHSQQKYSMIWLDRNENLTANLKWSWVGLPSWFDTNLGKDTPQRRTAHLCQANILSALMIHCRISNQSFYVFKTAFLIYLPGFFSSKNPYKFFVYFFHVLTIGKDGPFSFPFNSLLGVQS